MNKGCDFLHWLMINIQGERVDSGQTLAQYVPPFPMANVKGAECDQESTVAVRQSYVVLVFEQPARLADAGVPFINCFTRQGRDYSQWNTLAFLDRNRMSRQPVAATFFHVRAQTHSHPLQAECDASVRDVKWSMGYQEFAQC